MDYSEDMNYAMARERHNLSLEEKPGLGLWDWTTMNGESIWRSNPCTEKCEHESSEAAEHHFYNYCLDLVKVHHYVDEQRRCAICRKWTSKTLGNDQMWLAVRSISLCDKHLTVEFLSRVVPFSPRISIIHS